MKAVRRPRIDVDVNVATHGVQFPVRGVVHTTEGSDANGTKDITGVAAFWKRQGLGLGAHVLIDKAGNSGLGADPDEITWAVAGRNTGSVHIELIGYARFKRFQWLRRRKQLDKLARWMAWLSLEYGIKLKRDANFGWSGHRDQPNANHTDPGPYFPWPKVLKLARKYHKDGWA